MSAIFNPLGRRPNPSNLYVATTGSDTTNDGSLGSPFLTLQKAVTTALQEYDFKQSDLIINVGAGSFAGAQANGTNPGGGFLVILGAGSGSTTITSVIVANDYADIKVGSLKITSSSIGLLASYSSTIWQYDADLEFGAATTALVYCINSSRFWGLSGAGVKISGGGLYGFLASTDSHIQLGANATHTITGTPAFSASFVDCIVNSSFNPGINSTWSGSATGVSFATAGNSFIDMEQSPSPLPGTGNGIAYNGAVYYGVPNTPTTLNSIGFGLLGNISSTAWTTSGVRYVNTPATLTDTTSTGTVALAYTNSFGANTIAASNSTTFTRYVESYFGSPSPGTNVTFTDSYALGTDSIYQSRTSTATSGTRYGINASLETNISGASSANYYGQFITTTHASNQNITGGLHGLRTILSHTGSGTIASSNASYGFIGNSGSGVITTAQGNSGDVQNTGTGSITSGTGGFFRAYNTAATGTAYATATAVLTSVRNDGAATFTNARGFSSSLQNSGGGTFSTAADVYLQRPIGATTGLTSVWSSLVGIDILDRNPSGAGTNTLTVAPKAIRINSQTATGALGISQEGSGFNVFEGGLGRGAPVTKTGDFTLAATEHWIICNKGSTLTVTLPSAASFPGRELHFKTIQAFTVVSASSNVVPNTTATAGTAILPGTDGAWSTIVSDGTNWITMASSTLS